MESNFVIQKVVNNQKRHAYWNNPQLIWKNSIFDATIFSETERIEFLKSFVVPFAGSWTQLSQQKFKRIMVRKMLQKIQGGNK